MTDHTTARELGLDPTRLANIGRHFEKYVDDGHLPGWQLQIARHGKVAYRASYGRRDVEGDLPVTDDTIFFIASMTKPVTSVAAMMLYEEGAFELTDPVSKYIPSFANPQIVVGGTVEDPILEPAVNKLEIRHLFNHTAGLTNGPLGDHLQNQIYIKSGLGFDTDEDLTSEQVVDMIAAMPLRFEPGTQWLYSCATDVLGRLVEVLSGMQLGEFCAERIFGPLGMKDTTFQLRPDQDERIATTYAASPDGGLARVSLMQKSSAKKEVFHRGAGGLVSTTDDYQRFCSMLLNRGELDGVRLLGTRTVDYMATNSLPGNADLVEYGIPLFAESKFEGIGFGLGFSVTIDPIKYGTVSGDGDYGWGGFFSTTFWVDPKEDMTVIFMTQLMPSATYPIRTQLKQLVNAALVD